MPKRVVLAGGSGFLGDFLSRRFYQLGYEVLILSRGYSYKTTFARVISWDAKNVSTWMHELEDADLLVNLCGRNINCRFNSKNRLEILESRVNATKVLGRALAQCQKPPPLWINFSAAGFYAPDLSNPVDEITGKAGTGFFSDVVTQWEEALFSDHNLKTRKIALRLSVVLGNGGGALKPLKNLVKLGLGGKQGSGQQFFSWIHESDLFEIICFLQNSTLDGAINATSPKPITNQELMRVFRKTIGIPIGIPAPSFIVKLGALFLQTESDLILRGQWVLPTRLLQEGFKFEYPTIDAALLNIFR